MKKNGVDAISKPMKDKNWESAVEDKEGKINELIHGQAYLMLSNPYHPYSDIKSKFRGEKSFSQHFRRIIQTLFMRRSSVK